LSVVCRSSINPSQGRNKEKTKHKIKVKREHRAQTIKPAPLHSAGLTVLRALLDKQQSTLEIKKISQKVRRGFV